MRNRSHWLRCLTFSLVSAVLLAGIVPSALADPKGKPGVTPPGVPPGKPFQALQREINALDVRVTALEATAPQAGLMWINPLDFRAAGASTLALDATGPGRAVTGAGAGPDTLQGGLQVPLGFAVTSAKVCYVPGPLGSFISSVQLLQYAALPATPPGTAVDTAFVSSPGALSCVDTTPAVSVDPSAGGALYLSLGVSFSGAEAIVIRAVGLELAP